MEFKKGTEAGNSGDDERTGSKKQRFSYTWDCENRLIEISTRTNLCASVPLILCHFSYDYMGRRVGKQVYSWATNNWSLTSDSGFLYDGWNLISEVGRTVSGEPVHTIAGRININPNNSSQNEFVLTLPDGSAVTRDDLTKEYAGYSGEATGIHIKPKGNGNQDGLLVDGEEYELNNSEACAIASQAMTVELYNDRVDKKGRALGQWWIAIEATDATITVGENSDTPTLPYSTTNFYTWGTDLSGSLQGAGGIGGLQCVIRNGTPYYPCYDGNGNISEYVDTNGVIVAHREYDPFGNTIVATGSMVNDFNFWFSTKYLDQETGLYYYGYRYYSPSLGRWLSRDPLGEDGGLNLYAFLRNNTVSQYDLFGMLGYNDLLDYVGKTCCTKPCSIDLSGKHRSIEYSSNAKGTGLSGLLAIGDAYIVSRSRDCDYSLSDVSWWSCSFHWPTPKSQVGSLPSPGLVFACPSYYNMARYSVCKWVVRLYYLSCESSKWELEKEEVEGFYRFFFSPWKAFFEFGTDVTQVYP